MLPDPERSTWVSRERPDDTGSVTELARMVAGGDRSRQRIPRMGNAGVHGMAAVLKSVGGHMSSDPAATVAELNS